MADIILYQGRCGEVIEALSRVHLNLGLERFMLAQFLALYFFVKTEIVNDKGGKIEIDSAALFKAPQRGKRDCSKESPSIHHLSGQSRLA